MEVLRAIPPAVTAIYCIDDACPEQTGHYITATNIDPRVTVHVRPVNGGVGAATIDGYEMALAQGADICVKIDSDAQMDPSLIPFFVEPIMSEHADYTKGNRFFNVEDLVDMPRARLIGNIGLSFLNKFSSGYWNVFDPTNGYTAIHARVLERLPLAKIDSRFYFESDMLFRLGCLSACVKDIPIAARYGDEDSNLKIQNVMIPFFVKAVRNSFKRIFFRYILRDFAIASVFLMFSLIFLTIGFSYGFYYLAQSWFGGKLATPGQVMLSALPIIVGIQFGLSFLHYDIDSSPREPIHPYLPALRSTGTTTDAASSN